MSEAQDGGSAFPLPIHDSYMANHSNAGMSLRDYFAGQVIVGILSMSGVRHTPEPIAKLGPQLSETAYAIADAMIEARKKK